MTISIQVKGLEQLNRNIKTYSKDAHDKVSDAIQHGALSITADAKRIVPVDTGALRNSIQYTKISDLEAEVGTNIEYAPHVEFGTIKQRAQPYLTPATELNILPIITAVKKAVNDSKP